VSNGKLPKKTRGDLAAERDAELNQFSRSSGDSDMGTATAYIDCQEIQKLSALGISLADVAIQLRVSKGRLQSHKPAMAAYERGRCALRIRLQEIKIGLAEGGKEVTLHKLSDSVTDLEVKNTLPSNITISFD